MSRQWTTLSDLAAQLLERAEWGKTSTISADTARKIADALMRLDRPTAPQPRHRLHVDFFSGGSTIYQVGNDGELVEVVAWARNALVARAAYDEMAAREPESRFEQRRRAYVEKPAPPLKR